MPPFSSASSGRFWPRNSSVLAAAAVAAGALLALSSAGSPAGALTASAGSVAGATPEMPTVAGSAVPSAVPAGSSEVATLHGRARKYSGPDGRAGGWIPGTFFGVRSVLPVIATSPGWVRVRLAQRPNGATAWIRAGAVTLNSTPYRIVINVSSMHLTLYKSGRKIFSAAAGVGTRSDPTPLGRFFVAFLEAPPHRNPGYGPFIMVTSAHSTAISDWSRSGDAVIGIHGPLGDGKLIGARGARVSHGCIRLHANAQRRLRDVPAGSPIDIIR